MWLNLSIFLYTRVLTPTYLEGLSSGQSCNVDLVMLDTNLLAMNYRRKTVSIRRPFFYPNHPNFVRLYSGMQDIELIYTNVQYYSYFNTHLLYSENICVHYLFGKTFLQALKTFIIVDWINYAHMHWLMWQCVFVSYYRVTCVTQALVTRVTTKPVTCVTRLRVTYAQLALMTVREKFLDRLRHQLPYQLKYDVEHWELGDAG